MLRLFFKLIIFAGKIKSGQFLDLSLNWVKLYLWKFLGAISLPRKLGVYYPFWLVELGSVAYVWKVNWRLIAGVLGT
jgi:hypothetical protein